MPYAFHNRQAVPFDQRGINGEPAILVEFHEFGITDYANPLYPLFLATDALDKFP